MATPDDDTVRIAAGDRVTRGYSMVEVWWLLRALRDNNVFQQKPAFNVAGKGSLSILPHRLALTGTLVAPPGSAEDVR